MKRSNTLHVSQALKEFIRETRIDGKLKEVDIINHWETLLGRTISRYTCKIYISNHVLYVEISSPVVKSELVMMREEIREKLNRQVGEEIVRQIVFR